MNQNILKTLIFKDWREIFSNKQASLPMVIVPLIFVLLMPLGMILSFRFAPQELDIEEMALLLDSVPANFIPTSLTPSQTVLYLALAYLLIPMFLLIPVMVSSITATFSFVGEKENKTIEGLLYTPATDKEIIMAKILVSLIPGIIFTWISFLVYALVVNSLSFPIFQQLILPNLTWLLIVFLFAPALSFFSLALMIHFSQKATSVWEAQQSSMFLIFPIIGLLVSQSTGLIFLHPLLIALATLVLMLIDYLLYRWLISAFNRERLVTRLA